MNHAHAEPQSNRTTKDASSREGSHFSLHLTPFKYLDFTEVFNNSDQCKMKNQAAERHSAIIWRSWKNKKESGKMDHCERDLPVFSNTRTKQ